MPESYALALSAPLMLALGARGLAGHLSARMANIGVGGFALVYATTLLVSIGLTTLCVGQVDLPVLTWKWVIALAISVPVGAGCATFDRYVLRSAWKRGLRRKQLREFGFEADGQRMTGRTEVRKIPLLSGGTRIAARIRVPTKPPVDDPGAREMALNVGLACIEEVTYRGALVQLASVVESPFLHYTIILSSVLMFCIGHANFGIDHIYSKLPLAVACMCLALSQGALPAVSCHVVFNVLVTIWIRKRRIEYELD